MSTTEYANDVSAGITTVETFDCSSCGLVYGMDARFVARRRADGRTFYCPNGHPQAFTRSELDLTRERLERANRRLDSAEAQMVHERDQRQAAERSARAYKGQVTKIRRRVGNGVCPCCQRTFADLGRHMAGKHPDYADGDQR